MKDTDGEGGRFAANVAAITAGLASLALYAAGDVSAALATAGFFVGSIFSVIVIRYTNGQ